MLRRRGTWGVGHVAGRMASPHAALSPFTTNRSAPSQTLSTRNPPA